MSVYFVLKMICLYSRGKEGNRQSSETKASLSLAERASEGGWSQRQSFLDERVVGLRCADDDAALIGSGE